MKPIRFFSNAFKEQIYDVFQFMPSSCQMELFSTTMTSDLLEITNEFMREPLLIPVKRDERPACNVELLDTFHSHWICHWLWKVSSNSIVTEKEELKLDTLYVICIRPSPSHTKYYLSWYQKRGSVAEGQVRGVWLHCFHCPRWNETGPTWCGHGGSPNWILSYFGNNRSACQCYWCSIGFFAYLLADGRTIHRIGRGVSSWQPNMMLGPER